jgi:hypothetical protein
VLASGRSSKAPPRFEDWWAKIYVTDISHPAWRHLTASAKDVMLICTAKAGNAASKGLKDDAGRPKFEFTFSEGKRLLHMPSPTFNRALTELLEKGFLGISRHGGICVGKGIPAQYHVTDKWKEWQPPAKDTTNIHKARAARKKQKQNPT